MINYYEYKKLLNEAICQKIICLLSIILIYHLNDCLLDH